MIVIEKLELELSHGTLGGLYTTVEGLLNKVHTHTHTHAHAYTHTRTVLRRLLGYVHLSSLETLPHSSPLSQPWCIPPVLSLIVALHYHMQIYDRLADGNPFAVGDSNMLNHSEKVEVLQKRERFQAFQAKLRKLCDGDEEYLPFQLKLRDPLGNSFFSARLGSFVPPECDPCLHTEDYERSFDDNEEFGLNDMNTRDFETGIDYN